MLLNVRIRNLYRLPNRSCWNTSPTSNRKTGLIEKKARFVSARHISDDFMSMRRLDLGSGGHRTETQDEIQKSRRHVQRKRFQFLVCVLCIAIVLISPQLASAQDTSQCSQHCWNKISQDVSFTDGVYLETITEEQDCKDTCFNNETCTGVYWGFNPTLMNTSCWLQMPYSGTPASLRNANYWNLTSSSDDCYAYCWLPKWINVHTTGGVLQKDINTEGQCKSACSKDNTCNGVDWDTSRLSCQFLFSPEIKRNSVSEPIHHWEIIRNLPVNLTQEEPNVVAVAEKVTVSSETAKKSKGQSVVAKKRPVVGPSVGENNVGKHYPAFAGSGSEALFEKLHCPNYMTGIITLTALMSVCFLIIILLIAYILFLRLELNKLEDLLYPPEDRYPSYESIRHSSYATDTSASETSGMEN